jgi:hypothetical protein
LTACDRNDTSSGWSKDRGYAYGQLDVTKHHPQGAAATSRRNSKLKLEIQRFNSLLLTSFRKA